MKKKLDTKGQSNTGKTDEMPDIFEVMRPEIQRRPELKRLLTESYKKKKLKGEMKKDIEETFGIEL